MNEKKPTPENSRLMQLELLAEGLFQESQRKRNLWVDRIFRILLLVQWAVAIILAITVSPYTWLAENSSPHEHVWMAVIIGGVLTMVPFAVSGRYRGTVLSRQMIAIAQVSWSAFLIHLSGGRIETHFHIFGSLAFLSFYRDWKIIATATIVVAADHAFRGIYWPQSVFGVITESPFRWIEHAAWVLFEDVFLMIAIVKGRQMAYELCIAQATMEQSYKGELDLLDRAMAEASCGILISDARDPELPLTYVNKTFEEITGYSRDEVLGKSCRMLQGEERSQPAINVIRKAIRDEEGCCVLLKNFRKNGEPFWNELSISPVRDENGELTHFLGIQNDVTERERAARAAEENRQKLAEANVLLEEEIFQKTEAEKEKERLNRELIEASRQAGMAEIATGVLHNVGNVMNSINIGAESLFEKLEHSRLQRMDKVIELINNPDEPLSKLLSQDDKGRMLPGYLEKLVEHLESERLNAMEETKEMRLNISHVAEIVSMQQTYARLGGMTESVHIDDLCHAAIRMNDAALLRHGVDLQLEFAELPKIDTEKNKVLQILVNFISNAKAAVSASDSQCKKITIRTLSPDDEYVAVEVIDNGIGISLEDQKQVFQHGFTTKTNGHGFGLHSSILAAREVGGDVTFESDGIGKGATFRLILPREKAKSKPIFPAIEGPVSTQFVDSRINW